MIELGLPFDSVMTKAPGHAITLASEAVAAGYTMIVSVGGDGTLQRGRQRAAGQTLPEQGPADVTVAVIPWAPAATSCARWALPRTWREACDHLLDDKTRMIDVGEMTYPGARARSTAISSTSPGWASMAR